ncbi:MAG: diadenylate cyclase CdaA [Verrucomicrobia bacterium]|nr:diadenylate cyclase CdaA [Verrucomicrobiota bacterium]MCH8528186.1 diadenylate cyclase CdaA [Kiritimatiellia bacterium]
MIQLLSSFSASTRILAILGVPRLMEVIEVFLLWIIFYHLLKLLRGTRGAQVLSGLAVTLLGIYALTTFLELHKLNWIFRTFSVNLVLALVIIFQPEIRKALAELGRPGVLSGSGGRQNLSKDIVEPLVQAVRDLSRKKIGALIAIEREIGLRSVEETGVSLDSRVTPDLLTSLFFPRSPLHDGGVVIRNDRLMAAGCVFPLSQKEELHRSLGTRHRAAIGITEETDAIVVVVSEETGTISLAYKGRLSRGLDEERLKRMLKSMLSRQTQRAEDTGWSELTANPPSEHGGRS